MDKEVIAAFAAIAVTSINGQHQYATSNYQIPLARTATTMWLCWLAIYVLMRLHKSFVSTEQLVSVQKVHRSRWLMQWLVSFAMVSSGLVGGRRTIAAIFPLTSLSVVCSLLLLRSRYRTSSSRDTEKLNYFTWSSSQKLTTNTSWESFNVPSSICLAVVGSIILYLNAGEISITAIDWLFGIGFLIARTITIIGIASCFHRSEEVAEIHYLYGIRDVLLDLAIPNLMLWTPLVIIVWPATFILPVGIVLDALLQAAWWCSVVILARLDLTHTTVNLEALGSSMNVLWSMSGIYPAVVAAIACGMSLTQAIRTLRVGTTLRKVVLVASLIYVFVLCLHESRGVPHTHTGAGHPIELAIESARHHFAQRLDSQSKTLAQAESEYQRRYKRKPPAGFDQWFEIAQQNNFVLVDEFDTFMQSIEPFYGVHPVILKQRLRKLLADPAFVNKFSIIQFNNHHATYPSKHNLTADLLLNPEWFHVIPYNMTLALNFFDEPVVSAPLDTISRSLSLAQDPSLSSPAEVFGEAPEFLDLARQSTWAATKSACSIDSPARAAMCPGRNFSMPLAFVQNVTQSLDVCQNCAIHDQHGLLMSPETLRIATDLIPVFSASKPSHFNDILYPSAYYMEMRNQYQAELDTPWHAKDNRVYWVGSATGGYTTELNWEKLQRQRLMLLTATTSTEPIQLLEETKPLSNTWRPRLTTMAELSGLFATRMARIVQANPHGKWLQEQAFGISQGGYPDPRDAAYAHKFVLDIDGNGFSGRFYRLLRSHSVVIKSTILKEWHDDRLRPWVHYVPLSLDYHELPEIARYLATTSRGEELSERIARESTQWHDTALRDVDLRVAWLRMLLEYGRLMNRDI